MKFITTAPDRRTLVKAIAAHTGMEPSYIGPPAFNYTVGTITIDREGYVDVPDEQAADLKAFLIAKGGITSSTIGTDALGVKKANVLGQICPGIPVWQTDPGSKFPGIPYVIFPGNVGGAETLRQAVETLVAE